MSDLTSNDDVPPEAEWVVTSTISRKPRPIRRIPRPNLKGAFDSPARNLLIGVGFAVAVMTAAVGAYVSQGWNVRDALYMVVVTVFAVGYGEVPPIDTEAPHVITVALIVLGCTGMIFLSSALVQLFTAIQLGKNTGLKRMNRQIEQLKGHAVVCGFGRLGAELARGLAASSAGFIVACGRHTAGARAGVGAVE